MANDRPMSCRRFVPIGLIWFAVAFRGSEDLVANEIPAATISLREVDRFEFQAKKYSSLQLQKLMDRWVASHHVPKPVATARLKKLFARLGHNSFRVRQAAMAELVALGPANLDAVAAIAKGEKDTERASRAKRVIGRWRRQLSDRPIRIRNLFRVWMALDHRGQLRYAEFLVDQVSLLPEEVVLPAPPRVPNELKLFAKRVLPNPKVRLRDETLTAIVRQLARHKTKKVKGVLRSFLQKKNTALVLETIRMVGDPYDDPDAAIDLLRLAEGKNRLVVLGALTNLSNWNATHGYQKRITVVLKRLYHHKDPEIALEAAIISCYSGDFSGFSRVSKATKSRDPTFVIKAVAQLGDSQFRHRGKEVVPALLPHLKSNDRQLLNRAIGALGTYPKAVEHVIPFLKHRDRPIMLRAISSLGSMASNTATPALRELQSQTKDEAALRSIRDALRHIASETKN